MKKILTLLIITMIAVAGLVGCGDKAPDSDGGFSDLEDLAVSSALAYRYVAWNENMKTENADFAWYAAGWYAAYKAANDGTDDPALTAEQVNMIQDIMYSGTPTAEPAEYIPATSETRDDGKTYWVFDSISEDFASYLGVYGEVSCEKVDDTTFNVTIRDHLRFDVVEETVFHVVFTEDASGYSLTEFSRSEFYDLDFTLDSLYEANLLSNLFSIYDNVTMIDTYPGDTPYYTYYIKTADGYAYWIDEGDMGCYNEFQFFIDSFGADRVTIMPIDTTSDMLDDHISYMMLPSDGDELIRLTCTETEEIFFVENDEMCTVYTIDRGTLALKKVDMYENEELYYTVSFDYETAPTYPETITAWDEPLRTVTLNLIYSDDESLGLTYSFPADWEFDIVNYCPWGEAYFDEGFSEPYEYPGDGVDYTLYVKEIVE